MAGIIVSNPPAVELPPGNASGSSVLPGVTYQYAVTSVPQTWTALQTFPLGTISVQVGDIAGGTAGQIIVKNSATAGDASWQSPTALGTGVGAFLATPTSLNLHSAVTDAAGETDGALAFIKTGLWTPVITFGTPGNLAITYSLRNAYWTKIGRQVIVNFVIATSAFTHTTASGGMSITGLPFTAINDANYKSYGAIGFQGYTKAAATLIMGNINGNSNVVAILGFGSGAAIAGIVPADVPSGGALAIVGCLLYVTDT